VCCASLPPDGILQPARGAGYADQRAANDEIAWLFFG
jgi:hypothetical protein